ncbi:MAG TPA: cell wall metabolism sensor histidine kinase WalK [Clostridiales bacterium]|nr:cell wall metabolism sensor histidine kinase WalK [Clostridiales bacterium]
MRINKRFFSSLRWRIAFAYLMVIGIGFFIINISIMEILEQHLIDDKKTAYQKYSIQLAQIIANGFYERDPNIFYQIREFGNEIDQIEGESTRILILNDSGIVEMDSYQSTSLLRRNLSEDYSEVSSVLQGESVPARDLIIATGDPVEYKRVLYAYAPITHYSEGIIGMVFLSTSLDGIESIMNDIRKAIVFFSAIISVSIILVSLILSGFITHPIKELTAVITKMSKGYLNQRINIRGGGELRQLGEAFNIMSERLENLDNARNEFVSNASHELKTPLSAIKVLAESLLNMDVDDPAIYKEFLSDINFEIDRLNAIITDLLVLVQMDKEGAASQFKREPVDLNELARRTIKGLQLLAEQKKIRLEHFSEEEVVVMGDMLKLQQVISNIIDNGIKYTPDGGRVTVEVYNTPEHAVVKVSDTGIGISQKDISRIFDRFYRVDKARSRATGGTGLGLSIANKIVMLHHGFIRVTSEENKGTTFYIELPYNSGTEVE